MTRDEIVQRINKKVYEGLYSFDDIKYDLDDAIITINNQMHTKYPMMSEVLTSLESEYEYENEDEEIVPIFPYKYINNVVIEFVVAALFRREGEFGNEYNTAIGAYERGINAMFRELYNKVPEEFIDDANGIIPIMPFEVPYDE